MSRSRSPPTRQSRSRERRFGDRGRDRSGRYWLHCGSCQTFVAGFILLPVHVNYSLLNAKNCVETVYWLGLVVFFLNSWLKYEITFCWQLHSKPFILWQNLSCVFRFYFNVISTFASLKTGNQVWYCQSTKAKVTLWSVDLIEGLNCWNMLWKS